MTALTLFVSTFILVFTFGLQSLNFSNGHHHAAMFTSFFIGSSQMALFKLAPYASWLKAAGFLLGSPVGIYAAMCSHHVWYVS
jgi:hypothetical protein